MSRENLSVLPTVPTGTSSRKTATCFKVLPAFSPRLTCDSSLSSAIAKKRFADFAETEEGRGPASRCKLTLLAPSKRIAEILKCAFFFYGSGDHRDLHSFPTRRSSDLSLPRQPPDSTRRWLNDDRRGQIG